MCGILGVMGPNVDKARVLELSHRMSHRGPDERDSYQQANGWMITHERLSIIDLTTGKQPIQGTSTAYVVHNGEIYNHADIHKNEFPGKKFRTTCDSEIIVHLYEKYGYDFCNKLDGMYSFIIMDGEKFMVGRDPIGIKPLYYGKDAEGRMWFSSEMKSITDQCLSFEAFPPGHYYSPETGFVKYNNPVWEDYKVATNRLDLDLVRETLTESVRKRLMSDVPLGVLLSGGLDSSLIASIMKRLMGDRELHSFSVGLDANAPDLLAARKVADFIGTTHHEIVFSFEEALTELEKIIWNIESYDVTTIRASTPMYFLSRAIVQRGIKVVLSGEGADEVFGGYLYFHNAPSSEEFQKETIWRVQRLSTADCLRADKSTMAHGLEAREPMLDRDLLNVAMLIRPEDKQPNRSMGKPEKYPLRAAFDTPEQPYLPKEILWRQKEQFSDGVGYSWIDQLVAFTSSKVSDAEFATAETRFPHNTPTTKEAFYYRTIFEKHFPQESAVKTVLKWIPKWQKSLDPSGRACDTHENKIETAKA